VCVLKACVFVCVRGAMCEVCVCPSVLASVQARTEVQYNK